MAFSADVVEWDLPEPAERGDVRHHIKEASAYSTDSWTMLMTLQLSPEQFEASQRISQRKKGQRPLGTEEERAKDEALAGLRIDYSGLDVGRMWHSSYEKEAESSRPGMQFMRSLDKALPAWTDPMLLTAVAGVAVV